MRDNEALKDLTFDQLAGAFESLKHGVQSEYEGDKEPDLSWVKRKVAVEILLLGKIEGRVTGKEPENAGDHGNDVSSGRGIEDHQELTDALTAELQKDRSALRRARHKEFESEWKSGAAQREKDDRLIESFRNARNEASKPHERGRERIIPQGQTKAEDPWKRLSRIEEELRETVEDSKKFRKEWGAQSIEQAGARQKPKLSKIDTAIRSDPENPDRVEHGIESPSGPVGELITSGSEDRVLGQDLGTSSSVEVSHQIPSLSNVDSPVTAPAGALPWGGMIERATSADTKMASSQDGQIADNWRGPTIMGGLLLSALGIWKLRSLRKDSRRRGSRHRGHGREWMIEKDEGGGNW
jgi:hypothetical protein